MSALAARELLARLAGVGAVAARGVAVVVAHPDDETIGCGGQLGRLEGITLVHVTDGAPRNLRDTRAHGFATPEAYAAARRQELETAAGIAGIGPEALIGLGVPDQQAAFRLADLARRLAALFSEREIAVVLTHACEGGHPDHDAVAFAVHAACRLSRAHHLSRVHHLSRTELGCSRVRHHSDASREHPTCVRERSSRRGSADRVRADVSTPPASGRGESDPAPAIIEMPFYRAGPDGWVRQRFIPESGPGELALRLSDDQRRLKARLIAAHRSQQATLASFTSAVERFRPAPACDFTVLPNGGDLLYERHNWGLTGARWQALVRAAFAELCSERAA